jgi:beta-lactam-binding protein with PASTA domain
MWTVIARCAGAGVVDNSCNNIGVVFSQSPDAGTSLHIGSAVSITLGVRPKHGCP